MMNELKEWEGFVEHLKSTDKKENLNGFIRFAYHHKHALAIWQLPHTSESHLIIDFKSNTELVKPDLEDLDSGFIFNPFQKQGDQTAIFIKNHLYFNAANQTIQLNPTFTGQQNGLRNPEELLNDLNKSFEEKQGSWCNESPFYVNTESTEAEYISLVEKAIEHIKEGFCDKIVPARTKIQPLSTSFDPVKTYLELCDRYPNALISYVSIPGVGTWMGATPEKLISVNKDKEFSTVAMAGTQSIGDDQDLLEVSWRQKEIEEQAMVSRYIINCFKKIRLREFEEHGPRTARAGKLAHLKTDFKVDTVATNFPQLGSVMIDLLHPTSAVCGMPMNEALQFLIENEGFDRKFFSGFLGPVNMFEASRLFVNIRCMQLSNRNAYLYAGAGVTEISDPEKEWEETNLKLETLLRVIRKSNGTDGN